MVGPCRLGSVSIFWTLNNSAGPSTIFINQPLLVRAWQADNDQMRQFRRPPAK
jgi:hypothetical protein